MALQGTIDTFPLTDVLALLASSARSGRLTLSGDRGSGTLWIHDRAVLGGEMDHNGTITPERIVFELLRFHEGSFEFVALDTAEFPSFDCESSSVEQCVSNARSLVEEWVAIEAVVPSVAHRVELAAELPSDEFTIDRALWRVLVLAARCGSVADLGEALGVDEYDSSALVASLVNEGLVEVSEPWDIDDLLAESGLATTEGPASSGLSEPDLPEIDLAAEALVASDPAAASEPEVLDSFPDHFPIDDLILGEEDQPESTPWDGGADFSDAYEDDPASFAPGGFDASSVETEVDDTRLDRASMNGTEFGSAFDGWDELVESHGSDVDTNAQDAAEEVLRQMSKLSPKAAEAIAAALGAPDAPSGAEVVAVSDQPVVDPIDPGSISFLDSF